MSLVVAFIAGFVLVRFSLPALVGLLDEFGGELPFATKMLISMSEYSQDQGTIIALAILGVGTAAVLYMSRTPHGIRFRDRMLLGMPMVGPIIVRGNMFALTSTLTGLLRSGVSPVESLRLASQSLTNVVIRDQLILVTSDVAGGMRLGPAFARQPVFPRILSQAAVIADLSGSLAETLEGLANYYEKQTEESVTVATELIQPVVTMIVAGIVAFIAIAVVGGVYSTLGSIEPV